MLCWIVRACDDRLHGGESADGRLSAADFPEVADSSQDYRLRPADRSHRFGPVSRTGNRTGICRRRVGRCAVTVNSDVGKVTLNKRDLLLRTVGSKEALTASVAVENGVNVPITWVSSNPGVATVDASGVVTAVADGEAKITALSPDGRFDSCSVFVGLAADKYDTEEDLAEELKLPDIDSSSIAL